jgi:DNA-binding MarR family transcriptional regulator
METLAPEICSCAAIRQAARHLTQLYDEILTPSGISLNQYSILAKLDRFGRKPVQELAALLVMDRSTLGRLLRPLEARGLITIELSAEDRRQRIVALTKNGVSVLKTARALWGEAEARFESVFGQANAVGLRAMMRQVTALAFHAAPKAPRRSRRN